MAKPRTTPTPSNRPRTDPNPPTPAAPAAMRGHTFNRGAAMTQQAARKGGANCPTR